MVPLLFSQSEIAEGPVGCISQCNFGILGISTIETQVLNSEHFVFGVVWGYHSFDQNIDQICRDDVS